MPPWAVFTMACAGVTYVPGRPSQGVADGARLFFFPLMVVEVPAALVDGGATGLPHRESTATRRDTLADGMCADYRLREGWTNSRDLLTAREDFFPKNKSYQKQGRLIR